MANVRRKLSNIIQLGLKELRSLYRDPAMLVLIIYSFTLAIYEGATAVPEAPHRASIAVVDEIARRPRCVSSTPSNCPTSLSPRPSPCSRWTAAWMPASTPSP